MVRMVIKCGANINQTAESGLTALHLAVRKGKFPQTICTYWILIVVSKQIMKKS